MRTLAWLAVVAVLLVAFGAWWWMQRGAAPSLSALDGLAAAAPAETRVFAAVDLRDRLSAASLRAYLKDWAARDAEVRSQVQDLESRLGVTADDLARWVTAAGFVAVLPPAPDAGLVQGQVEWVAGSPVVDEAAARDSVGRMLAKADRDETRVDGIAFWTGKTWAVAVTDGCVLGGSSVPAVQRAIACLRGKVLGLAAQPVYREARGRFPGAYGMFALGLVPQSLAGLDRLEDARAHVDEQTMQGLAALPYVALAAQPGMSDVAGHAFLKVDAASATELARALLAEPEAAATQLSALIPASLKSCGTLDVPWLYRVAMEVLELFPEMRYPASVAPAALKQRFGAGPEELGRAFTGGAALAATGDMPPSFRVVLGVQDVREALRVVDAVAPRLGGPIRRSGDGRSGSMDVGGTALRWKVLDQPGPALVLGIGARSAQLVDAPIPAGGSVAELPAWRTALEKGGGGTVGAWYVDLRPMLDMLKRMNPAAAEYLDLAGGVDLSRNTAVATVRKDGVEIVTDGQMATFGTGLAAAVLVPNFIRARAQGQSAACAANVRNLGTAAEMYSVDNDGGYPTVLAPLAPRYLKALPTCPSAGVDTYSEGYAGAADAYTVVCAGSNHAGVGLPANFPQYTSAGGLKER